MNPSVMERDELFKLVETRVFAVRKYLLWAQEHDNGSLRMSERNDIKEAAEAAGYVADQWWGLVVFSCFGSVTGAQIAARKFRRPLDPHKAKSALADIVFPPRSVAHHRCRPGVKGAKEALVAACEKQELFHDVLRSGADFDTRYRRLREAHIRQWGRTTSFDLLLRAGSIGACGQYYRPAYAYLKDSAGPGEGFRRVWGIPSKGARVSGHAEALLRAWTENWKAVAKRVGVEWHKPPLEPCDQENFLCIFHQQRDEQKSSESTDCVRAKPRAPSSRRVC